MNDNPLKPLSDVDASKRDTLRKLIVGSAYVVPAIASFSMSEVNVLKAQSYTGNTR